MVGDGQGFQMYSFHRNSRPRRVTAVLAVTAAICVSLLSATASAATPKKAKAPPRPRHGHQVTSYFSYYLAAANGGVFNLGGSKWYGSARGDKPAAPIVAIASTPDERGYFLAGADGAVYG
ncbi:MAG: hypothetical protein ACRDZ5_10485, partial [Acidimicrobiales bacterium]